MNTQWALPVPILSGELFSSWLARAALTQGCDPLALTGKVWPKWRVWTLDPDRGMDAGRLKSLSKASGILESRFEAAMLRSMSADVSGNVLSNKSVWPWTLALGSRNRKRHGGLQFCPACLKEDRDPYYRLQWRLAWHTGCIQHGCRLLDRCPTCNASIEPHRLSAMDGSMSICATCKADLRDVALSDSGFDALEFQKAADVAISRHEGHYGQEQLAASEWFTLARYFVMLLRKASLSNSKRLVSLVKSFGVEVENMKTPATGLALELLPVGERDVLLGNAWKFLSAGPDDFLRAAKQFSLTAQSLREPRQNIPACLEKIVRSLPGKKAPDRAKPQARKPGPLTRHVVMRKLSRLRRKMQTAPL